MTELNRFETHHAKCFDPICGIEGFCTIRYAKPSNTVSFAFWPFSNYRWERYCRNHAFCVKQTNWIVFVLHFKYHSVPYSCLQIPYIKVGLNNTTAPCEVLSFNWKEISPNYTYLSQKTPYFIQRAFARNVILGNWLWSEWELFELCSSESVLAYEVHEKKTSTR